MFEIVMMAQAAAPAARAEGVLTFEPAFFAASRPNTAFDMISRLPGFSFDPGQDARGFAGTAGNVLIDGQRPSSKSENLGDILGRIPANQVARIELIRGSAPGIDMQGRAVIANVVRRSESATSLVFNPSVEIYPDGKLMPALKLEGVKRFNGRVLEGGVDGMVTSDGVAGKGFFESRDAAGALQERARLKALAPYREANAKLSYETPIAGGASHFKARLHRELYQYSQDALVTFPAPRTNLDQEHQVRTNGELSADYERRFGAAVSVKLIAIQNLGAVDYTALSVRPGLVDVYDEKDQSGESIGRATLSWRRSSALQIEAGGEAAFNVLKVASRYVSNGANVPLPSNPVRVEERRAEAFATATLRPNLKLSLEAGLRLERSTIGQSGATDKEKSFFYAKPRLLAAWSIDDLSQARLRIEREVGQLNFNDFASQASLQTGSVNAGNPNLVPQQGWVEELTLERRFWGKGAVLVSLLHANLDDVQDLIPIAGQYDAPGNIGKGAKDQLGLNVTLPLDRLGVSGGLLKTNLTWRRSSVVDPVTGTRRRISGEDPMGGGVHFTQDLIGWKTTWGIDSDLGFHQTTYRINEIRLVKGQPWMTAWVDYKPSPATTLSLQVQAFLFKDRVRRRVLFDGPRDTGSVVQTTYQTNTMKPLLSARLRRSF